MSAVQQALLMYKNSIPIVIGAIDPYFSNVSLLLHIDGANGSTTFTDNSNNDYSPTLLGSPTPIISTTQVKFGTASGQFQSSGISGLQYPVVSPLDIYTGNGSFTVEMWVYPTSVGNYALVSSWRQSGLEDLYLITIESGVVKLYWGDFSASSPLLSGGSVSINSWTHIAIVRDGNNFAAYVNGTSVSTATFSTPSTKNWWYTQIGLYADNNWPFNGYIDDLRITKTVARYTGNFTPPTEPFPNSDQPYWISLYGDLGINVRDDYSSAVTYDSSGNIYNVGADGNLGITFLVKYDPSGTIIWQIQFSEVNNYYKSGDAVEIDSEGNVYVVIGTDDAVKNFTLLKLNPSGSVLWQITFDGTGGEAGVDISIDNSNNVYVAGVSAIEYPLQKSLLVKVNSSGVVQWQRTLTGTYLNYCQSLAIDSLGNIYLNSQERDNSYFSTPYLIKYNSSGVLQWQKQFTDGASMLSGLVVTDSSNNVYTTNPYAINAGVNLIKWDSNGNILWQKILNPSVGCPVGLKIDSSGNIYVVAAITTDIWNLTVYKLDNSGSEIWQRILNGTNGIDFYYYWATQNLAIYNDKFSISGYTYTPGLPNSESIVAQLPTDGTGIGTWGNFTYSIGTQTLTTGSFVATSGVLVDSPESLSTSSGFLTLTTASNTNNVTYITV